MAVMDSAEILQALRALEKKQDAIMEALGLIAGVVEELADEILGPEDEDDEEGEDELQGGLVDALREVAEAALEESGKQARRATRRRR